MKAEDRDERLMREALRSSLLREQQVEELRSQVRGGESLSHSAMRLGYLDAAEIDILESLLSPQEVIPGYEIAELIGRGGMGVVYQARQLDLDRWVALKIIRFSSRDDPTMVDRFRREAMSVARLTHPNIVQAFRFGEHQGRYYFAMEFVSGPTCERWVSQFGPMPELMAWHYLRQTASGLLHAQKHDVLHRDIKPSNLILVPPPEGASMPQGIGMIKIADFGLAAIAEIQKPDNRLTSGGMLVGSPAYMAPERFADVDSDHRGDIYAIGVMALELLTGQLPWLGLSLPKLVRAKSEPISKGHREWKTLESIDQELILLMTQANADDRPADYETLIEMIDHRLAMINQTLPPLDLSEVKSVDTKAGTDCGSRTVFLEKESDQRPIQETSDSKLGVANDSSDFVDAATSEYLYKPKKDSRRLRTRRFVTVALGLGLLSIAGLKLWQRPSIGSDQRTLKHAGASRPLFDGQTLSGWDVSGAMRGAWQGVTAPDGSTAIACLTESGTIQRRFDASPNFRLGLFFAFSPETETKKRSAKDDPFAIVEFGTQADLQSDDESEKRVAAIQFRVDGIDVGTKDWDGDGTHWTYQTEAPESWFHRYHVIHLERQPTAWFVFFEEKFVGAIPIDEADAPNDLVSIESWIRLNVQRSDVEAPTFFFAELTVSDLSESGPAAGDQAADIPKAF